MAFKSSRRVCHAAYSSQHSGIMTRKRKKSDSVPHSSRKKPKIDVPASKTRSPVLALCYTKVLTLRDYLLTRLPPASRVRRKKLQELSNPIHNSLLDTYLVGISSDPSTKIKQQRVREFVTFTQTLGSTRRCHTGQGQSSSVEEVVDFVVWLLFRNCPLASARPRHILCNGLQKGAVAQHEHVNPLTTLAIPGVVQQHPNENLDILKRSPWDQYLALLGAEGEAILTSLLLDCGLFIQLEQSSDNYLQVSGTPICDLNSSASFSASGLSDLPRKPSEIFFIRNRILYAKPSLNKQGNVHFGMKHIHVLQRYSLLDQPEQTLHVIKHIFPRQFGLHNVFTNRSDPRESSQQLPDYTYREEEFSRETKHSKSWVPPRLRGGGENLVRGLRKGHARCSYTQLLWHYCPTVPNARARPVANGLPRTPSSFSTAVNTQQLPSTYPQANEDVSTSPSQADFSFLSHATPSSQVSTFCSAVMMRIVPRSSLGTGLDGKRNWNTLLHSVHRFVQMRRFETLNLHDVCSSLRILCIDWLQPPKVKQQAKISRSDISKRLEILREFVYYIFDSLLIPLIRSNFYVTESGVHRNRLFFFRHDVWRKLSEPSLAVLRLQLYQPMKSSEVRRVLDSRTLGYSNVRLLPKAEGTRPITNLRRRMLKLQGGKRLLGPSINAQLRPVFNTLGYERHQQPSRLGGAIFSTSGLHDKLKHFKLMTSPRNRLFFVKVDIQSCFDTIPQTRLMEIVNSIIGHPEYRTTRYIELKSSNPITPAGGGRCSQKFAGRAQPANEEAVLSEAVAAEIARGKEGVVLMDTGNQKVWQRGQLMKLLQEHVQNNIVKIGKKHVKQTNGIPQGSVLSSTLCSFFYSEFEMKHLNFITPASSLLVRLIDDFLLVTDDKTQALEFLRVMIQGKAEYGISVNPEKTLVNFEAQVGGQKIPRHDSRKEFPFCGVIIDTKSMEVRKDWQRKDRYVNNGLTVDSGRRAGTAFRRKTLLSFKMQMQAMLLDSTLNCQHRIASTYLEAFEETAMKMHQYARNMSRYSRPTAAGMCKVMMELIRVASKLGQKRQPQMLQGQARNPISKSQMTWIAATAFERVLLPKQTEYQDVLKWLRSLRRGSETGPGLKQPVLKRLVENHDRVLNGCVY